MRSLQEKVDQLEAALDRLRKELQVRSPNSTHLAQCLVPWQILTQAEHAAASLMLRGS